MGLLRRIQGGLLKVIKIIILAIGIILLLVILWPVILAVISVVTTILPGIIAAVQWILNLLLKIIKPVLDLLKPAFDALKSVYDNFVKPVLLKVQGAVDVLKNDVYKVYNLTIGGVQKTYQNLFGWVDGLQTEFNGFADRVVGLVSVVDQRAADRLNAARNEINRTIDKYSSDIFSKVILKINEVAGPILKSVSELAAAVNEKLQTALDLGAKATSYTDFLERRSEEADLYGYPVVQMTEARSDQAYEDQVAEQAKEEKPPKKEKTVWDVLFEGWIPFVEEGVVWLMEEGEKVIDANIDLIYTDKIHNFFKLGKPVSELKEGEVDDDFLRVLIGDMKLKDYIRVHWGEIAKGLFTGQKKELTPDDDDYWAVRYDALIKQGVPRKRAMSQIDSERWALNKPPMFAKEK